MNNDYKSFEDELETIIQSLDEDSSKKKTGFWGGPHGGFLLGYLSSILTMGVLDYSIKRENFLQSLIGEDSIHWYLSIGMGFLFASYRLFERVGKERGEFDYVIDLEKTDLVFEDMLKGKSKLSEKTQKVLIMNQFWSTVSDESRKSLGELCYLVSSEGWGDKSAKEMLTSYLPLIEYNQKNS